jgi:hypothetical protein
MKYLSLVLIIIASFQVQAALWVAENQWDQNWENQYSEWISKQVKPQFFIENQITTDCADAVISLRWIFSRINSLPMASSSGSGLITNLSNRWDSAPTSLDWKTDQRFRAALRSINDSTDTKTLFRDIYPTELNVKNLKPGTLFVEATSTTGHAQWISHINFDGVNNPIMFYSSTVPQAIRETLVYPFMKIKWPEQNVNAFGRFRWPVQTAGQVKLASSESMPGYSLEQYQLALKLSKSYNFDDFVTERLTGHPLEGLQKLQNLVGHLAQRLENRVPVVVAGFNACAPNKCIKDSTKFYNHSTYSRDGAIQFLIIGITEMIYSDKYIRSIDDQIAGRIVLKWSQLQNNIRIDLGFKNIELGYIVNNWNESLISSDPNDTIEKRWGFVN